MELSITYHLHLYIVELRPCKYENQTNDRIKDVVRHTNNNLSYSDGTKFLNRARNNKPLTITNKIETSAQSCKSHLTLIKTNVWKLYPTTRTPGMVYSDEFAIPNDGSTHASYRKFHAISFVTVSALQTKEMYERIWRRKDIFGIGRKQMILSERYCKKKQTQDGMLFHIKDF